MKEYKFFNYYPDGTYATSQEENLIIYLNAIEISTIEFLKTVLTDAPGIG